MSLEETTLHFLATYQMRMPQDDFFEITEELGIKDYGLQTGDLKTLPAITWNPNHEALVQRHGLPFSEGGEVSKTAWEEINGY